MSSDELVADGEVVVGVELVFDVVDDGDFGGEAGVLAGGAEGSVGAGLGGDGVGRGELPAMLGTSRSYMYQVSVSVCQVALILWYQVS